MDANKKAMLRNIRQALVVTLVLLLLCGFAFPVLLSGLSGLLFPHQAGGSLGDRRRQGTVGAEAGGTEFTEAYFMKGRPSPITTANSLHRRTGQPVLQRRQRICGAGLRFQQLRAQQPCADSVCDRREAFLAENPGVAREDIPADLMTASGSGLDPHISPAAAQVQLPAIAEASGLSPERLAQIVADNTEEKLLGVFGEETVNVLGVNLDIALRDGADFETEK